MNIVPEEWRSIEGFKGYEVSNLGAIRSVDRVVIDKRGHTRKHRGRILRQWKTRHGYMMVTFNGITNKSSHRVVAEAWLGPIPQGKVVNHIDGNKTNNAIDNLEYVTPSENTSHAIRVGLLPIGEKSGSAKWTENQIKAACNAVGNGASYKEAARATGVSEGTISNVRSGGGWKHLNLHSPRFRISPDQIKEVHRLYGSGMRQVDISRLTGISTTSVHGIIHKKQQVAQ